MNSDYNFKEVSYDGGMFRESILWDVPIKEGANWCLKYKGNLLYSRKITNIVY